MEELWNHQNSSKSWPSRQTEQSGEKGLGQAGDQEPDGHSDQAPDGHSDRALEVLCGDGRTFQKDQLCSTPPAAPVSTVLPVAMEP